MCQLDTVKSRAVASNKLRNTRSRRDLAQNAAELVKIHRFCQMEIEASFSATLDVVTRCIAGYCHSFYGSFSFRFPDDIVAVSVWQCDIAKHNVELFGVDHVQRAPGAISR